MLKSEEHEITALLQGIGNGDRTAESDLLRIVYGQLHGLAERRFKSEGGY